MGQQGTADRDHLLLPARQPAGPLLPQVPDLRQQAKYFFRALFRNGRCEPGGPGCEGKVLPHSQAGEHAAPLGDIGDA